MSSMAIPVPARSIFAPPTSHSSGRLHRRHFIASSIHHRAFSFSVDINLANPTNFSTSSSSGIRSSQSEDAETSETENFSGAGEGEDEGAQKVFGDQEKKTTGVGSTFLVKLAIALGIAATVTLVSISFKNLMHGPSPGAHYLADGSSASTLVDPSAGFTFKAFGHAIVIPQYAPGWIYFWLLMAAGCGLFISEEALNIWVGISLARLLSLDGTWQSFVQSFSRNAPYIISTVLWVYWGVCISDMIPFYIGKLFRRSGASDDVYSKLGISKDKAADITNAVQRYGNLIGFGNGAFFSWREKPNSFPSRGTGYFSRVFLCGCLLWWTDYSSGSEGCSGKLNVQKILCPKTLLASNNWIPTPEKAHGCCCNGCIRRGNMDGVSILNSCINSYVHLFAPEIFQLVLAQLWNVYNGIERL